MKDKSIDSAPYLQIDLLRTAGAFYDRWSGGENSWWLNDDNGYVGMIQFEDMELARLDVVAPLEEDAEGCLSQTSYSITNQPEVGIRIVSTVASLAADGEVRQQQTNDLLDLNHLDMIERFLSVATVSPVRMIERKSRWRASFEQHRADVALVGLIGVAGVAGSVVLAPEMAGMLQSFHSISVLP